MKKYTTSLEPFNTARQICFALLLLFIINSCDHSANNNIKKLNQNDISSLCQKIAKNPTQSDVNKLVSQIDISISNPDARIYNVLKELFVKEKTLPLILESLSTYTVPNFDMELSQFPFKINELEKPQAQVWLKAVKRSGGNMCFDTLISLAIIPQSKPTISTALNRSNLYITLSSINYINTCKQALMFYLKRGDDELELLDKQHNPIIYLITNLPDKRASFPEIYEFLNFYIPYRTSFFEESSSINKKKIELQAKFQSHPMLKATVISIVDEISKIDAPFTFSFIHSINGIPFYDNLNKKYIEKFRYKKSYPQLPYLGGILRKFATKKLSTINIEYKKVTHKLVSDILIRYQFDSLSKSKTDKIIDLFYEKYPTLEKSPNLSSIKYLQILTTECVAEALNRDNPTISNINQLAYTIVQKEFEIMNLALYAIAKVRDKKHIINQFSLDQYETYLYKISALKKEDNELVSNFSENILPSDLIVTTDEDSSIYVNTTKSNNKSNPQEKKYLLTKSTEDQQLRNINNLVSSNLQFLNRNIIDTKLLGRTFSISQGMYTETLKITYDNGKYSIIKWYGLIPQKYLLALLRFPRVFDLANISFSKEEWKNSLWRNYNFKTEAEVVLMCPEKSLPLLYYSLRNVSIPLEFVIDEIRLSNAFHFNYQPLNTVDKDYFEKEKASSVSSIALEEIKRSSITPLIPLRPKSLIEFKQWYNNMDPSTRYFLDKGYPTTINRFFGNHFCHSEKEYDTMKEFLLKPVNYLTCYKITDMAYGPIRQYIQDNQKDYVGAVPVLSWLAPKIFGNWNKAKERNLQTCDYNIGRARASIDYMSDWDFLNMPIDASMSVYMRQTIINSTFTKFLATYQINFLNGQVKFLTIEGNFDRLPISIKKYILKNQELIQIANLDLSCATISSTDYFKRVYQTFANDSYGQFSTENLLKISGYLWQQPIAIPETPFFVLYNSPYGKILASEIKTYLKIWDIGRFGSNINDYTPTEDFIKSLREIQIHLNNIISENAKRMSDEQIENIHKEEDNNKVYSFSITFGGQGTNYSTNYSNGNLNIGIGIFKQSDGQINGFAALNGMSVYSVDLTPSPVNSKEYFNSLAFAETRILSGLNVPLNSIVTTNEKVNRSLATTNVSTSYWHKDANGFLEYSGPVVVINDNYKAILGPYIISQDLMAKYDIKGIHVIRILDDIGRKISPKKAQEYLNALEKKTFTPIQFNELLELRRRIFEQTMIEDGTWAQTEIVESLLPDKHYLGNVESIDSYIDDINKNELNNFNSKLSVKQRELKTPNIVGKQVRWKIIYDKNYNFIRMERYFILKDGDVEKLGFTGRIPFFLDKELLKKNPNSHLYEKMMKSLLDTKYTYSDPKGLGISTGDRIKIDKILKTKLKPSISEMKNWSDEKRKYIESLTIKDSLQRIKENYFNNLKTWLSDPVNQGQFVPKPLSVSPLEFPFLYLYPYLDENLYHLEYLKERLLQLQKTSFFYSKVLNGNIVLK